MAVRQFSHLTVYKHSLHNCSTHSSTATVESTVTNGVELKSDKPAAGKWAIRLFGGLSVSGPESKADRFDTKRSAYLLARLALSNSAEVVRNELADFLWPDDFYDATRLRLRQELVRLRRALGDARNIIWSDTESVGLGGDVEVDVREFLSLFNRWSQERDASERESLCRTALSLASKELLAGFDEPWINAERVRFNEMRYVLLIDLAAIESAKGEHEAALEAAREAIAIDPYREEGHLVAMKQLGSLGFLTDALAQYQHLKSLLKSEFSELPSDRAETEFQALQQTQQRAAQAAQSFSAEPAYSIPAPMEPIYGRDEMIAHVSRLLSPEESGHRFVTLRGPGGIGKTRVALQVAKELQKRYAGRVGWVSLADLSIPENIPQMLAQVLAIDLGPGADPLQAVCRLIGDKPVLLVLDNLEQLLPKGIEHVKVLLSSCPNLRILVTSRVPLKVAGERSVTVGPLPLLNEEDLLHQPSMVLFLDPLLAEQVIDEPTPEELQLYKEIVDRLEGIPLALQLASGRLHTMSARELKAQLEHRLDLVNPSTDAPDRHRTLRAAIEGSYRALNPELQQIMRRMAVFRGGWDQSAAAFACDLQDPLPAMERLIDSSLVRVDREGKGLRFRMLETIREYILEGMSSVEVEAVHKKHADWLIDLAQWESWRNLDAASLEFFDVIDPELDNIREAARYCLDHDLDRAVKIGVAYGKYWLSRSLIRESIAFYKELFDKLDPDLVSEDVAKAAFSYAMTLYLAQAFAPGDIGFDISKRTEKLLKSCGFEVEVAMCWVHQSRTSYVAGDMETSLELLRRAQQRFRELNSMSELAQATQTVAMMHYFQGKVQEAIDGMEEALELLGDLQIPFHQVQTSMMLAFMYLETGEIEKSKTQAYKALNLADSFRLRHFKPMIQEVCGKVAYAEGDLPLAAEWFRTSAKNWEVFGNTYQYADQLNLLARVQLARGESSEALPLLKLASELLMSKNMVAVVPCILISASKAHLVLGNIELAARLMGAYKNVEATARDASLATEIAYVQVVVDELQEKLGSARLDAIMKDAPGLEDALKEAFG